MIFDNNGSVMNYSDAEEITTESMSLMAEAALIDTLNDEELGVFLESSSDINACYQDEILMEKSIVKLDKFAKLSRMQKMSLFTIAKEKNDPIYKKLVTLWRLERVAEEKLEKKYGNEAMRRAKKSMQTMKKSTSSTMSKVASKVEKKAMNVPIPKVSNKNKRV